MKLRACHISDTHDVNQSLNMLVPNDIDIVFFTGDMTYRGADWELDKLIGNLKALKQRVKHIVCILGNHEVGAEGNMIEWSRRFKEINVQLLHNEGVEIEGIKIWGSAYTPYFFGWAFQYENKQYAAQYAGEYLPTARDIWNQVPEDTQVLLSHCPPFFILDLCANGHVGCPVLRERIEELPSITHSLFGHLHESHGTTTINGVIYINSSIMDGKYRFVNKPHIFDIK